MKDLNELKLENKKYIIFDLDGTLIDSMSVWNLVDFEIIKKYKNIIVDLTTIQNDRDIFLENNSSSNNIYRDYCEFLINKYNIDISIDQLFNLRSALANNTLANDIEFKSGVVELIKEFKKRGYILVLATITTKKQIDIYAKKNKKMYSKLNILEAFDLIVGVEQVKNKKPDPEAYLYVLNYYNAQPSECLVFEDSLQGVLASKAANLETVNIYDKNSDFNRYKILKLSDYYISCYEDFLNYLYSKRKVLYKKIN